MLDHMLDHVLVTCVVLCKLSRLGSPAGLGTCEGISSSCWGWVTACRRDQRPTWTRERESDDDTLSAVVLTLTSPFHSLGCLGSPRCPSRSGAGTPHRTAGTHLGVYTSHDSHVTRNGMRWPCTLFWQVRAFSWLHFRHSRPRDLCQRISITGEM